MGTQGNASELGEYVAAALGFFKDEGLDVKMTYFKTGPEAFPALASRQVDLDGGGFGAGLFNAVARGIPVQMVADLKYNPPEAKATAWVVRSDLIDSGRFKEAKDFKGLILGQGATGTPSDIDFATILQNAGLTDKDVTVKALPYSDMVAAFANKSIDFAYLFEPFLTTVLSQGTAKIWKTSGQITPNHEEAVLLYGPAMQEKADAAKRYMVGNLRGVRWVKEAIEKKDPKLVEIATKYSLIKDPGMWNKMQPTATNPDGYVYLDSQTKDLTWYIDHKLVQQSPSINKVINNTYVDYAISRLGKYKPGCGTNPCR